MLIFLALGAFGLVLLLTSLLIGNVFDLLDGSLSGTTLGAGLTMFAASGALAWSYGLSVAFTYPIAIAVGVSTVLCVGGFIRRLRRTEDTTAPGPHGMLGTARTRIAPSGGEVSLDGPYELETRLAISASEIPAGTRIRVIGTAGASVTVKPLKPNHPEKE